MFSWSSSIHFDIAKVLHFIYIHFNASQLRKSLKEKTSTKWMIICFHLSLNKHLHNKLNPFGIFTLLYVRQHRAAPKSSSTTESEIKRVAKKKKTLNLFFKLLVKRKYILLHFFYPSHSFHLSASVFSVFSLFVESKK
jgi:hypothetical protein